MRFSIIIPIYKVELYLRRCIDSVLKQTFTDFECILVDDGSPDRCPEICDEYANKDNRIKVIHKVNGGLSDARNAGLDIAKGEYIYFLDGDDYIESSLLENVQKEIKNTNADMVVFNYFSVNEHGDALYDSSFSAKEYTILSQKDYINFVCKEVLHYKMGWEVWNRVFKHSIIDDINLRFYDNKKIYAEDIYFLLCYLLEAHKVSVIDKKLHYYVRRSDSITGANKKSKIDEFVNLNYMIYQFIKAKKYRYIQHKYYIIFYLIINNRYIHFGIYDRLMEIQNIVNKKFFRKNVYKALLHINELSEYSSNSTGTLLFKEHIYYLLNSIIGLKGRVLRYGIRQIKKTWIISKNLPDRLWKKNIYLLGTEDFGNVGDHLIAISEIKYLKDHFPHYNIIEISASKYWYRINEVQKRIKKKDMLFLTGGGNMGDMYPYSEKIKEDVISRFKSNKIIIFPQTIYFDNLENIEKSKRIYDAANKLIIAARELYSYNLLKEIYPNAKILLVPDIVFYNNLHEQHKREGISLCLRNDNERTMTKEAMKTLMKILNDIDSRFSSFDMQFDMDISLNKRQKYIEMVLQRYYSSSLIITDRLHGMIVSTITETPCVAIGSKSYKMKGTYEWIKDLEYIEFIDNVEELSAAIKKVMSVKGRHYSNVQLKPYFEQIVKAIDEV